MNATKANSLPRHEFVYLILSHNKLDQLLRLIKTLRAGSPESAILLHHDAKSALPDMGKLNEIGGVYLVEPRVPVQWGDVSQLDALLGCITYAIQKLDFSWIAVISGQDYPLRHLAVIEAELRDTSYDAFVKATPVATGPYRTRYYLRYYPMPGFHYAYLFPRPLLSAMAWLRCEFNRRQSLLRIEGGSRGTARRLGIRALSQPFSDDFVCYKGSDWFTLSRRAVEYLISSSQNRPEVLEHYRRTFIPSESYYQTVLCNAKELKICDDHRHFIVWEAATSHPKTLTIHDLDVMVQSGKDWGRKFDTTVDSAVLDALDRIVLGSPPERTTAHHPSGY